jgi:hypothetical protein
MANAEDFTYSKGYLGLLSMLGASLGIALCCMPSIFPCARAISRWWKSRPKGYATGIHRDVEKNDIMFRTRAKLAHGRWTILRTMREIPSVLREATLATRAPATNPEDTAPVSKLDTLDLELTKAVENGFSQIEERIARRWSLQIPERVYSYKPLVLNDHEDHSTPFPQLTRHNSFPTSFQPSLPTQTRHQNTSSGSTAFLISNSLS